MPQYPGLVFVLQAHKEGEICMGLGLCTVQPEHKAPELLNVGLQVVQPSRGTAQEVNTELKIVYACSAWCYAMDRLSHLTLRELSYP